MALAPWRQAILPVIVMKPIWATAITAMVVATEPSIVPCSQFAALTKPPEPGGSIDAAALAGSQIRAIAIATGPTPKLIGQRRRWIRKTGFAGTPGSGREAAGAEDRGAITKSSYRSCRIGALPGGGVVCWLLLALFCDCGFAAPLALAGKAMITALTCPACPLPLGLGLAAFGGEACAKAVAGFAAIMAAQTKAKRAFGDGLIGILLRDRADTNVGTVSM